MMSYAKLKRFSNLYALKLRFLVVGAVNTVVGLGVYPILYVLLSPIEIGYLGVLICSQVICISISFLNQKYFVFKTTRNKYREYAKFFTFHCFYLTLNLACLPIMVEAGNMNPIIAQLLFSSLLIITSYYWHSRITFKP